MAARLTIGGVDHLGDLKLEPPLSIDLLQNGRSRLRFTCQSGYEPDRFEEVVAYAKDGTTPIYGGLLLQRSMAGAVPSAVPAIMACECVGFEAYLDWCYLDLQYLSATTLQAVLDDLVAALPASYGLTLDATDYSGIPLAPFTWSLMRASDGLRELSDRLGRVYRVSPLKVLSMPLPGTLAAPADFTDATPNHQELTWQDASAPPLTTVKLICGPTAQQNFTARLDTDGVARSWTLDGPAAVPGAAFGWTLWFVRDGHVVGESGHCFYLLVDRSTAGPNWPGNWDDATLTLSLDATLNWDSGLGCVFTNGVPSDGWYCDFSYLGQYPFIVTAGGAGGGGIGFFSARYFAPRYFSLGYFSSDAPLAGPEYQLVATYPDVLDRAQGQEVAEGLLLAHGGAPRTFEAITRVDGYAPGQTVNVSLAGRSMVAACAVTEVSITLESASSWVSRVRGTELTVFPGTYLDQWRALLGGAAGGGGGAATGGGVVVVGGTTTLNTGSAYLGGSRNTALVPATAAYLPVVSYVPYVAASSFSARIRVDLWAKTVGVSCTARIYNMTDSAPVTPSSLAITATTATETSFVVPVEVGKKYRLEILGSADGEAVYGIGQLDAT